jgi:cytochrome c oxidase subunit 2
MDRDGPDRLRRWAKGLLVCPFLALSGCNSMHSALSPGGAFADKLADHIWFFTWLCTAIWVLVMVVLAVALVRRRSASEWQAEPLAIDERRDRRAIRVVAGAVAATVITVVVLTVSSYLTNKSLADMGDRPTLTLQVTGHQWWWEVRYEDADASRTLTTANEIHIPVGEPVRLKLASTDVIHSFWVPSLMGKEDLITGRQNILVIQADRPGVFRGQCAEFCGLQHAHMGVLVIAEPREAFDAWYNAQLAPAAGPTEPERQRGKDVFLSKACVMCHQVRGTTAGGRVAPELTHIGSRQTIAAGTLPLTRGSLAAWIADPQAIKPGANMPRVDLDADELNAVVSYLEGLK